NVILHRDVEYFSGLHELFSYYPVVGRGCRIPARVIVDENDCRRSLRDRFPEHLAGMDERRVEKPAGYRNVALESVLRIEHGNVKLLDREILQTLRKDLVDVAGPAHRRALLPFFGSHPPTQFQRRVDTHGTSRSDTPYARESGHRLRREQPQRTSATRKYLLSYSKRRSPLRSTS